MKKLSKILESIWSDMQDRGTGDVIKKEDELIPVVKKDITERLYGYCRKFVDLVTYMDAFEDTLDGFLKFINSPFFVSYYVIQYKTNCKSLIIPFVKRNWDKDENYKKYIDERIKENKDYAKKLGYKDVPDESMADVIEDWWIGLDEETQKKICFDEGYDDDKGEYFKDLGEIPDDLIDWWERLSWKDALGIYHSYYVLRKVESIWSDMQDRGNGDSIKAEDDIEHLDRDGLQELIVDKYELKPNYNSALILSSQTSPENKYISLPVFAATGTVYRMSITFKNKVIKNIYIQLHNTVCRQWCPSLFDKFLIAENGTGSGIYICSKKETVTNRLCMDVIETIVNDSERSALQKREN